MRVMFMPTGRFVQQGAPAFGQAEGEPPSACGISPRAAGGEECERVSEGPSP